MCPQWAEWHEKFRRLEEQGELIPQLWGIKEDFLEEI